MTEIGNFIVAHWETLLGVLLLLLATDGVAGYLPDKWVPYVGAVKRIAQILLTRFGKIAPVLLAAVMLSGCAGLKSNLEDTGALPAIPPPPGLSSDGARGIRVEGAVVIGATGSISEETNTMTFDDGDGAPVTLNTLRAGAGTDDQTAAEVANTPAGSIVANTVQGALNELDTDKQAALNTGVDIPWIRTGLTGSAATDLDAIPIASIANGDLAIVHTQDEITRIAHLYRFDTALNSAENSPGIIRPDDFSDFGVWVRVASFNQDLTGTANVAFATGNFTGDYALTAGTSGSIDGKLQLKNATNSNIVTLKSGQTSTSYTITQATAAPTANASLVHRNIAGDEGYTLQGVAPSNVLLLPADPAAHTLFGFDNTTNTYKPFTIGANLSYDQASSTLSATAGTGVAFHQAAADPTVNDDITTYTEGTIWQNTATNHFFQLAVDTDGAAVWATIAGEIEAISDPNADRPYFWDDSAGAPALLTPTGGIEIVDTNLQLTTAALAKINRYHQTAYFDPDALYAANAAHRIEMDGKTAAALTISEIYVRLGEGADAFNDAELTLTCYQKAIGVDHSTPTTIGTGDTVSGVLTISSFTDATVPAASMIWCVIGDDPAATTVEANIVLTGSYDW